MLAAALLLLLITSASSCKEPTKPIELPVTLEAVSVAVTDVRLKVSMNDSGTVRHYRLARDGELRNEGSFVGTDTTLADRSLVPNTSYTYRAFSLHDGQVVDSSDIVLVITMDTTSHEFSWQWDTLAQTGTLFGVYALTETDVWVVGTMTDKIDGWNYYYNAAHWDGSKWDRINIDPGATAYQIIVFSIDDIWVAASAVNHWDGQEWHYYNLWDMGVLQRPGDGGIISLWGTASSNLYFGVQGGVFVHYDGATFTKIETPTDMDLRGIAGNSKGELWITADASARRGSLLHYNDGQWKTIWDEDNPFFSEIDTLDGDYLDTDAIISVDDYIILYTGGALDGITTRHLQEDFSDYQLLYYGLHGFARDISASGINDLFVVGNETSVTHFNGSTSFFYDELFISLFDWWLGVDQVGDKVFIVGNVSGQPVVVRGERK